MSSSLLSTKKLNLNLVGLPVNLWRESLVLLWKYYLSHGQLFPASVPKIDKDASLLDLASSRNVNFPVKSLETMELQT